MEKENDFLGHSHFRLVSFGYFDCSVSVVTYTHRRLVEVPVDPIFDAGFVINKEMHIVATLHRILKNSCGSS